MKKLGKILKIVAVALLVILIVAIVAFLLFGEHAIKVGIETAATKTLNVGVDVNDVDIRLLTGKFGLSGLVVQNPTGYQHPNLLVLDDARVNAQMTSLASDTVNIKTVVLDGIELTIEQKDLTNNLKEILDSIPKAEEKPEPAEPEAKPAKQVKVERLEIKNTTVKVKLLPVPGKVDTVTLKLDPIVLENLGGDEPLNTGELVAEVLVALSKGVARQGVGILPDEMINTIQDSLKGVLDVGEGILKEGGKILEEGAKSGSDVIEGFKGLLKPKEREEKSE